MARRGGVILFYVFYVRKTGKLLANMLHHFQTKKHLQFNLFAWAIVAVI